MTNRTKLYLKVVVPMFIVGVLMNGLKQVVQQKEIASMDWYIPVYYVYVVVLALMIVLLPLGAKIYSKMEKKATKIKLWGQKERKSRDWNVIVLLALFFPLALIPYIIWENKKLAAASSEA